MAAAKPWYERGRVQFLRFWRTERPAIAMARDIAVAGGVVLLLLGLIWAYTGQSFPNQAPLVVVESGSMMHGPYLSGSRASPTGFDNPPFGRVGTIDPGDLVLVKRVSSFDDVATAFGQASRSGYGGHGDVVVYKVPGKPTPIIHRALLLVRVDHEGCMPNSSDPALICKFIIPETCNQEAFAKYVQPTQANDTWQQYCGGSSTPITLSLKRDGIFVNVQGFPCTNECGPAYSGLITKGDNNPTLDQPVIACCPIQLGWLVGKARGEIPWFGLIKLTLYANKRYECRAGERCTDPTLGSQWSFFGATAPWDIWVSLFVAVGVLVALPVGVDFVVNRVQKMRRERRERPGGPPPKKPESE